MTLKQRLTALVVVVIEKLNFLYGLYKFVEKPWNNISHNFPPSFNVTLRYKITKDRYTLDLIWEHNHVGAEEDYYNYTLAILPDIDSSLVRRIYLDDFSEFEQLKGASNLRIEASDYTGIVLLKGDINLRQGHETNNMRITAPITKIPAPPLTIGGLVEP